MKRAATPLDRQRCAGLSLAELVLALAATALVGTAVVAMLHAVAYGSRSGTDLRDLVPRHRVLAARFADAVRNAEQVVEVGSTEITLWAHDLDGDGDFDSNEIAWIKYAAAAGRVEYETATGSHTAYAVTPAQIASLDIALSGSGDLDTQAWGRDLSAFSFDADSAAPTTALVTWRQTFTLNGLADTQVHAAEVGSYE